MTKINFLQNMRVGVIQAATIMLLCAPTYAENSASSKLYELLEETNSISARFHQKISYDLNKSVAEQFLGDFLFLKPNHLRWVIEPPAAQEKKVTSGAGNNPRGGRGPRVMFGVMTT